MLSFHKVFFFLALSTDYTVILKGVGLYHHVIWDGAYITRIDCSIGVRKGSVVGTTTGGSYLYDTRIRKTASSIGTETLPPGAALVSPDSHTSCRRTVGSENCLPPPTHHVRGSGLKEMTID